MEKGPVEIFRTRDHFVLVKDAHSLWCSRKNGALNPGNEVTRDAAFTHIGYAYGIIGKVKFFADAEWKLLLITQVSSRGTLPHWGDIFCIEHVTVLSLTEDPQPESSRLEGDLDAAAALSHRRGSKPPQKERPKEIEKLDKRLTECLLSMFNDSQSFYYCTSSNLTQSFQRRMVTDDCEPVTPWMRVDERFFWNKWLLSDLIESNYAGTLGDPWILPVIQGYVECRELQIHSEEATPHLHGTEPGPHQRPRVKFGARHGHHGNSEQIQLEDIERLGALTGDANKSPPNEEVDGYESDVEDDIVGEGKDSHTSLAAHTDQQQHTYVPSSGTNQRAQSPTSAPPMAPSASPPKAPPTSPPKATPTSPPKDPHMVEGGGERVTDRASKVLGAISHALRQSDSKLPTEGKDEKDAGSSFTLALISRRSRHRAGMRYLRRGIDEDGYVANYVETEMVALVGTHMVTYNIVRGSVPVFWTQPGIKYRPNPIVERNEEETQKAFSKHFKQELDLYRSVAIVNLVNQRGMEQVLSDVYRKHALLLDNPFITYIEFDFNMHDKTDGIGTLVSHPFVEDVAKRFKFSWVDKATSDVPLCNQEGIFRVNCMDCLDRTNVVQSLFARGILLSLLRKLGLLHFEENLEGEALQGYKEMWANNGDVISRQYTGTAAMKGDLTRYGERKIMGMMKDGYYSANRYYQSNFRDMYKQVVVDLMQGQNSTEAFATLPEQLRGVEEEMNDNITPWSLDREENVVDSVIQCRSELYPDKGLRVQGWMLTEAAGYSFVDSSLTEKECVLLHCAENRELCVVSYKTVTHQIICFIRIPMERVQKLVIGPVGSILNTSRRIYMRLFYNLGDDEELLYFTFKTVNFTSLEEDKTTLRSIADTFALIQPSIVVQEQKLTRKRSPAHQGIIYLVLQQQDKDYDSEHARLSAHFDEEMFEASLSAPSSPEPGRRREKSHHTNEELRERRSQSFDDLLNVPASADIVGSEHPHGPYTLESDSAESDEENILGSREPPVEDVGRPSGVGNVGGTRWNRTEVPMASALSLLKGKAGKLFKKVKGHPDSNASTSSEQEDLSLKLPSGARGKSRDHSPSRAGKVGPSTKPLSDHGVTPSLPQGRYICI